MKIPGFACLVLLLTAMCPAQETDFSVGPQYLMTSGSPLLARPLATPSLSFESGLQQAGTSGAVTPQASVEQYQGVSSSLDVQRQAYLPTIYYGARPAAVVEISLAEAGTAESLAALPASIAESGVTAFTDAESLRQRGFGVTLGEAAQRWKGRPSTAPHVYTNRDIERLRDRS